MNIQKVVDAVLESGARVGVYYRSPGEVIRATRVCYLGKFPRKGSNVEIVLTLGRPNYLEREFIRKLRKAKEPFPVKKVQLKFPKK